MDHGFIVLETDEKGRELLREAATLSAGVDAQLDVISLITADEYEKDLETLEAVGAEEHTSFDASAVLDRVKRDAEDVVEEELADLDLDLNWRAIGARVGDGDTEAERVLEVAERREADHLFVPGRRRSPTGKVVFGDRAQSILLNFDGPVTTLLG